MTDHQWPLQQALFAALEAALSCPVYDSIPPNTAMPYCHIESQSAAPFDVLVETGSETFVYLGFWSSHKGQKEVLELMDDVYTALHRQRLTLSAGEFVDMRVTARNTTADIDGRTYKGSMTVKVMLRH